MLQTLKLLLPALFPSWRFFDVIGPSPRIEFCAFETEDETHRTWREVRPKPLRLPLWRMVMRLFWNPHWNDSLFLFTCAERLVQDPSDFRSREIFSRIEAELGRAADGTLDGPFVQFRLVFVSRYGSGLRDDVVFVSTVQRLSRPADA
jgi:hypothetical protein